MYIDPALVYLKDTNGTIKINLVYGEYKNIPFRSDSDWARPVSSFTSMTSFGTREPEVHHHRLVNVSARQVNVSESDR